MRYRLWPVTSTRTIIDYNAVVAGINSGCYSIICVNTGVLEVIRKLIIDRGLWFTTYAMAYDANGYYTPEEAEFDVIRQAIAEFLGEAELGCNDISLLADAVRDIALALKSPRCCGQPGTPGGSGTGGSSGIPDDPGPSVPVGTPPAGFDTWQDYLDYHCAVLTWYLDTVEADLSTMTTIQVAGATALALLPILAALLLAPIPGANLFIIAGLLIAIAAYGAGALSETLSAFQAVKADMLCAMYNATSPQGAQDAATGVFDTYVDANISDPVQAAYAKQLFGLMLTPDGINKSFALDTTRTYPAGDCSDCNTGACFESLVAEDGYGIITGSVDNGTYVDYTVQAQLGANSTYRASLNTTMCDPGGEFRVIDIVINSGSIDGGYQLTTNLYYHATFDFADAAMDYIQSLSSVAHTITYRVGPPLP